MTSAELSWPLGGHFPDAAPEQADRVHVAMYYAWLLQHGMATEQPEPTHPSPFEKFLDRQLTPGELLVAMRDAGPYEDPVDYDARPFVKADHGAWLAEYSEWAQGLGYASPNEVPDTWATYDALEPLLDLRFRSWNRAESRIAHARSLAQNKEAGGEGKTPFAWVTMLGGAGMYLLIKSFFRMGDGDAATRTQLGIALAGCCLLAVTAWIAWRRLRHRGG